jgi:cobalt-zinc-cadmium efflux system membrane fusion protein
LAIIAVITAAILIYTIFFTKNLPSPVSAKTDSDAASNVVELSETQLKSVKVETAIQHKFTLQQEAVGSIAYHEQEARNVHPSMPWHPGDAPVADAATNRSTRLLVANIPESDSPLIHVGQHVEAKVRAYPDRVFDGKISALGGTIWDSGGNPAVDPNTRRITVRCEIADPKNELYPGMLANIVIQVQQTEESVALPINGVVREGDGTMTIWVTTDRQHFEKRTVKVGLQQGGYDQILDGLKPDELVATDGALFIDNALTTASQ